MENNDRHEQEQALGRLLQRILDSQASWSSIELALARFGKRHPGVRAVIGEDWIVERVELPPESGATEAAAPDSVTSSASAAAQRTLGSRSASTQAVWSAGTGAGGRE